MVLGTRGDPRGRASGATQEPLVQEVVATLEASSGATRREFEVIPEDLSFKIPVFALFDGPPRTAPSSIFTRKGSGV